MQQNTFNNNILVSVPRLRQGNKAVSKTDQEVYIVWFGEVWPEEPVIVETVLHICQEHEWHHWNQA